MRTSAVPSVHEEALMRPLGRSRKNCSFYWVSTVSKTRIPKPVRNLCCYLLVNENDGNSNELTNVTSNED